MLCYAVYVSVGSSYFEGIGVKASSVQEFVERHYGLLEGTRKLYFKHRDV